MNILSFICKVQKNEKENEKSKRNHNGKLSDDGHVPANAIITIHNNCAYSFENAINDELYFYMLKKARHNRRYMCQINILILYQLYNWDSIFHVGFLLVTLESIRLYV